MSAIDSNTHFGDWPMRYCSDCGHKIAQHAIKGGCRAQFVCRICGAIHYQNPRVIVGCLAEWQDRILLCRRATAPRIGTWTLPAGFMENDESTEEATLREAREETGADIDIVSLYSLFDVVHMNEIYIIYRGRLRSPDCRTGSETSEVRLFRPEDLPWANLFYPAIASLLKLYINERFAGSFGIHTGSSDRTGRVRSFEDCVSLYEDGFQSLGYRTGA